MASPKYEAFALFHQTTGAALTGQAGLMSFVVYKDDLGSNITPVPTIVEIGGGWYGFLPLFPASPLRAVVYTLDTGTNGNPRKLTRYMRPEDYNSDAIPTIETLVERIRDFQEGKWEVVQSGANANHLVIYASDNTTVLKKYALTDRNGMPTVVDPFKRTPD